MDFWISFANFFASAIRLTAPIALGTLACTISERAGVINIGIEGSMLFSGFLAAVGSYYTGSPWVGLLCGCAAGAFLALILGVLAIYCNGQQIVIGIGLNLFGPGFAYMLMRALWDTTGISPWVEGFQAVNIPLLSRIPIAGTMLSGYPACIYLGLLAVAVMQYLLHRTAWGLRIRAVGENPAAVATLLFGVMQALRMRLQSFGIATQLTQMLPYLAALIGIKLTGMRMRAPAANGTPYPHPLSAPCLRRKSAGESQSKGSKA